MKKIFLPIAFVAVCMCANAQDFKTDIANARANYAAGKLSETHFNLQQAMQELDIIAGKEVIKILPPAMDTLASNTREDNVTATAGFVGTRIHRSYGGFAKRAEIEITSNSPIITTLNAFLTNPMMGAMMNNDKSKAISVQGYKARLEKSTGMQGQVDYTIEMPLNTSLITFRITNSTDAEAINLANTIPYQQIAKLMQ